MGARCKWTEGGALATQKLRESVRVLVGEKAQWKTVAIPILIIKIKGCLLSCATIQKSMTNKKCKQYQCRMAKQGLKFTMQDTAHKIFATRFLFLIKKGMTLLVFT